MIDEFGNAYKFDVHYILFHIIWCDHTLSNGSEYLTNKQWVDTSFEICSVRLIIKRIDEVVWMLLEPMQIYAAHDELCYTNNKYIYYKKYQQFATSSIDVNDFFYFIHYYVDFNWACSTLSIFFIEFNKRRNSLKRTKSKVEHTHNFNLFT